MMDREDMNLTDEERAALLESYGEKSSTVKPKKKAVSKKGHWLLDIIILVSVCAACAAALFYLPFFKVNSIAVVGNKYISTDDICRIAGIYKGQHLLEVETAASSKTLVKDLRIEKASVRRVFPNGIFIEVEERRPVANIACEYGYLDLDRQGMVLNAYRKKHFQTIPFLEGIKIQNLYIGDHVKDPMVLDTLKYLSEISENALSGLTEVNLRDPSHVIAYTTNAVEVRIGELKDLENKAKLTQDFLEELRVTKHQMEYIDLSFSKPFVRFRQ